MNHISSVLIYLFDTKINYSLGNFMSSHDLTSTTYFVTSITLFWESYIAVVITWQRLVAFYRLNFSMENISLSISHDNFLFETITECNMVTAYMYILYLQIIKMPHLDMIRIENHKN